MYKLPNPTNHYADAAKTGRICIVCFDIAGQNLACATIYGWKGGKVGTAEAARTDDLICICKLEFCRMPPGPKVIGGDLNGPIEAFPTLVELIKEGGWTDIGADAGVCKGEPN